MRTAAIILVSFLLLFGCMGQWRVLAEPKLENASGVEEGPAGPPDSVGYIYVGTKYGTLGQNNSYNVSFTLEDESGRVVAAPGTLKTTIRNSKNVTLYSGEVQVAEEDFEGSPGFPFYDNKAYSHMIDFGAINKSDTSSAVVSVEFMPDGGETLKLEKTLYLSYTLVNYSSGSSSAASLKTINVSAKSKDIEVTLSKGGITGTYYTYYETVIDFRNSGSKKKDVTITDAALVAGGKQYPLSTYYSETPIGYVYPGAAVSKTLKFTNSDYDVSKEGLGENATIFLELEVLNDLNQTETLSFQLNFSP